MNRALPAENGERRPGYGVAAAVLLAGAAAVAGCAAGTGEGPGLWWDTAFTVGLAGALLLGLNCAVLGSFVVVRRLALLGDTLSHAVLPGIALGFLWRMNKDPVAILVAATLVGGISMLAVSGLLATTRLKQDTVLGLVLSTFYGAGICLLTRIQQLPYGNKSGLDAFMFGQVSALSLQDVQLLLATTGATALLLAAAYPRLLVLSFNEEFGRTLGLPMRLLHHAVMLLTAFAIVTAMQGVGVVLVSAMLVIPPAFAYLLTDRMHLLLAYAAGAGMASAAAGAWLSSRADGLPAGPLMVLAGAALFAAAFLFGPRYGWLTRRWRMRSLRARAAEEDALKALYRILERGGFRAEDVALEDLAAQRRLPLQEIAAQAARLHRAGLATRSPDGATLRFTPEGERRARAVVRNHRLWELYLTNVARFEADHVHDDAEKIEHVLGEETVRQLERRLEFPAEDPHGKPIPGPDEGLVQAGTAGPAGGRPEGYG